MELNILILISTEKYFRYISDKNTSHHILKSSNGQTKEFVLKTFQLDCFRKSFVLDSITVSLFVYVFFLVWQIVRRL